MKKIFPSLPIMFRPMNKEILRLAIPNIISNVSVPLLSSVDTALMGRLSDMHIGAVGIGSMIFNFIYWNFGFLRMGTTGMTAQAFGKKDDAYAALTLGRAIMVALLIALFFMIFQKPVLELANYLMHAEGEQASMINGYFKIRIWAAPATLCSFAMMGWFFGMQNAIFPLIWTIVTNVINISANIYFVEFQGMGVDGVALGTVLAQYGGLLSGIIMLLIKYKSVLSHIKLNLLAEWEALSRFLKINQDIFIRTVCLTFVFGFFQSESNQLGPEILAVNVILLQFLNWMSYGVDGFAYAAESLVGKYFGADDKPGTKEAISKSFWWGMGMALIFSLIYALFGKDLLKIFTNQPEVIQAAIPFLFWMALVPFLGTPAYIWDGIFVGLTASKTMRNSMLLSLLVFILVYFTTIHAHGNHGLWMAMISFLLARGIIQFGFYRWKGLEMR
ncbi:MAG: MATE family efflux transporter [Saprospiraceae bacterium]